MCLEFRHLPSLASTRRLARREEMADVGGMVKSASEMALTDGALDGGGGGVQPVAPATPWIEGKEGGEVWEKFGNTTFAIADGIVSGGAHCGGAHELLFMQNNSWLPAHLALMNRGRLVVTPQEVSVAYLTNEVDAVTCRPKGLPPTLI